MKKLLLILALAAFQTVSAQQAVTINGSGQVINTNTPIIFPSLAITGVTNGQTIIVGGNGILTGTNGGVVTPTTLTFASTLIVNSSAVTSARCALTGNVLIPAPLNPVDGAKVELWLNATGGAWTLSLDTPIVIPSTSAFTSPTTLTSGKTYILLLKYDGVTNGGQWELASFVGGY